MNRAILLILAATVNLHASVESDLIKFEGFRARAYLDTLGHWTVGYGHRCEPGTVVDRDRALVLLHADISKATTGAKRVFSTYATQPPAAQEVLTQMVFQLGAAGAAKFPKFIAAVNRADFTAASHELVDSKWHTQTPARVETLAKRLQNLTH